MKLFAGIFIICALITEASSLKCISCVSPPGICEPKEILCDSTLNSCVEEIYSSTSGGKYDKNYKKDCSTSKTPISYNIGSKVYMESIYCKSDLCNKQPFPENPTPNGRMCYGCFDDSPETCANNPSIVQCFGIQDNCISASSAPPFPPAPSNAIKGCASKSICESINPALLGFPIFPTHTCCKSNLCNKGTRLPGSGISLSLLAVVVVRTLL